MLAAMNGHSAAVKLLLDMGSDINAQVGGHFESLVFLFLYFLLLILLILSGLAADGSF